MHSALRVLDCMFLKVPATANVTTYDAYPEVLAELTYLTLDVVFFQLSGLKLAYSTLLDNTRPYLTLCFCCFSLALDKLTWRRLQPSDGSIKLLKTEWA